MYLIHKKQTNTSISTSPAFTIVELLVVIVIIGILAAITIVSYTGITQKANTATLQSDLTNANKLLAIYNTTNSSYPTANVCPNPGSTEICLKQSSDVTLTYKLISQTMSPYYSITATKAGITYGTNESSTPVALAQPTDCPSGFIPVPGSATYGQAGFCVMKYEAKNDGSNKAVSTAAGLPWVIINQTNAVTTATAACDGCHLISEAEWMTLAQNVLSVPSNWSGGAVGTGYIYSGHNDNAPASALAADSNDNNGYSGETNTSGNQRRTLTLTNGQVIWDLAGNVWEWTAETVTSGQPGVSGTGFNWHEWMSVTAKGTLAISPFPGSTGLSGASTWNSAQGIGQIYSNSDDMGLRVFVRSGGWFSGAVDGVLALGLDRAPSSTDVYIGFRVAR